MEENKIYLLNQIDLNKILYSKVNDMNEKKLIHIFYEKPGQKLLFQTPQLLNIFDIQKSQYFSELILPLYDCNLKVPLLIKFLKDLDSKFIDNAKTNKNEWFKNLSAIRYKSLIKNLYTATSQGTPNSGLSKDDEKYCKNGLLKLKITNGVKIMENNNEIKLDDLKKGNFLRLIIELHAVWISKDVFGVYLKPVMIEQIKNKVMSFIDDKEDITEINYLETEANSEDEYIDKNDLSMVLAGKHNKLNIKTESSDTNDNGAVSETSKMYHFGLHNVNDDLFNTLKKDKKIVSILSELNSNNTKKDISLDEMSSEIDTEKSNKKMNNSDSNDDSDDDSDNMDGSDTSSDVKISSLRR
jgi:CRISPR/Cas system-associated endoribonuclease Cas2